MPLYTLKNQAILAIFEIHFSEIMGFYNKNLNTEELPTKFHEFMATLKDVKYSFWPHYLKELLFSITLLFYVIYSHLHNIPSTRAIIIKKTNEFIKKGSLRSTVRFLNVVQEFLDDPQTTYKDLLQDGLIIKNDAPESVNIERKKNLPRFLSSLLKIKLRPNISTLLGKVVFPFGNNVELNFKKSFFISFLVAIAISGKPVEIQNETLCVTLADDNPPLTIDKDTITKFKFYTHQDLPIIWQTRNKLLVEFMWKVGKPHTVHPSAFDDVRIPEPPANMGINQAEELYNVLLPVVQRIGLQNHIFSNQFETYTAILARDTSALLSSSKNPAEKRIGDFVRSQLTENLDINFEDLLARLKTIPEASEFKPDDFSKICGAIQVWLVQLKYGREALTQVTKPLLNNQDYPNFTDLRASFLQHKACTLYYKVLDSLNVPDHKWLDFLKKQLKYSDFLNIYQNRESCEYFFTILKRILKDDSITQENLKPLLHKLVKKPSQAESRKEKFYENNINALETALVALGDTELCALLIDKSRQARSKCDLRQIADLKHNIDKPDDRTVKIQRASAESFVNNRNRAPFLRTQPQQTTEREAEPSEDELRLESESTHPDSPDTNLLFLQ